MDSSKGAGLQMASRRKLGVATICVRVLEDARTSLCRVCAKIRRACIFLYESQKDNWFRGAGRNQKWSAIRIATRVQRLTLEILEKSLGFHAQKKNVIHPISDTFDADDLPFCLPRCRHAAATLHTYASSRTAPSTQPSLVPRNTRL